MGDPVSINGLMARTAGAAVQVRQSEQAAAVRQAYVQVAQVPQQRQALDSFSLSQQATAQFESDHAANCKSCLQSRTTAPGDGPRPAQPPPPPGLAPQPPAPGAPTDAVPDDTTAPELPSTSTVQAAAEGQETNQAKLSKEELAQLAKLRARDTAVKAHEQAHLAAAAGAARGGPTYSYQTGPDGRRYAVGGEVPIDLSKERTPEATIAKAQKVRAAALAPADPSAQDHAVAQQASSMAAEARAEQQKDAAAKQKAQLKSAARNGNGAACQAYQAVTGGAAGASTRASARNDSALDFVA